MGITPSKNEQECSGVLESMKFNLVVVILCHFFFTLLSIDFFLAMIYIKLTELFKHIK